MARLVEFRDVFRKKELFVNADMVAALYPVDERTQEEADARLDDLTGRGGVIPGTGRAWPAHTRVVLSLLSEQYQSSTTPLTYPVEGSPAEVARKLAES